MRVFLEDITDLLRIYGKCAKCADQNCERVGPHIYSAHGSVGNGSNGSVRNMDMRTGRRERVRRERVKRIRPQISYADGSQPVRRSNMRTWWNLISELTGGIDLILIYMGGN